MTTLADAVRRHCAARRLTDSGRRKLHHLVNLWARHCLPVPVESIQTAQIEDARESMLAAGLAHATIESAISDVLTVIRHVVGSAPDPGCRLVRRRPRVSLPVTVAEYGRLYEYVDRLRFPCVARNRDVTDTADYWRAWLVVAYWTGLRISDLLRLEWEDVESDRITRTANKTGVLHEWPLVPVVRRHLDLIRRSRGRVFPTTLANLSRYREALAALCRWAGVSRVTPKHVRQLSITSWSRVNPMAGSVVHGCGLGVRVLGHYVDPWQVVTTAAPGVEIPAAWLLPGEQSAQAAAETQLVDGFRRQDEVGKTALLRLAGH